MLCACMAQLLFLKLFLKWSGLNFEEKVSLLLIRLIRTPADFKGGSMEPSKSTSCLVV